MEMMNGHHDNEHRPFCYDGDHGPTFNNNNNNINSDIYGVVGVGVGVGGVYGVSSGAAVGVRTLQPFEISSTTATAVTTHHTTTAFKSPGGGMAAASLGFPFTSAQWKELERQAMIYKYMMASLPVPPDLLLPLLRHPSSISAVSHSSLGSGLNLGFPKGGDQEPGRCRRTDGKKWRCSRDVAPDQKYCERHMHRGRPRSRKHVEVPTNNNNNNYKKTRLSSASHPTSSVTTAAATSVNSSGSVSQFVSSMTRPYNQTLPILGDFRDKATNFETVTPASSYKEPRSLDWMMKEETVPVDMTAQQWQDLIQQTKIGLKTENAFFDINRSSSSVLNQDYQETLNLNSYASFRDGTDQDSPLFLNPNEISLEKSHTETPRVFIDAWSNAVSDDHNVNSGNNSSVSSSGKLSLSSLALSMGGNNSIDDEMGQIQMGLGVPDQSDAKPSSWLASASWAASTPGGPLAEVLRPSKTASTLIEAAHLSSPTTGDGDSSSPQTPAVSSPSGFQQKALASLSESSGSSSQAIASSSAKPEIALMWLNQSNQVPST